jgi:hypothetical protein
MACAPTPPVVLRSSSDQRLPRYGPEQRAVELVQASVTGRNNDCEERLRVSTCKR